MFGRLKTYLNSRKETKLAKQAEFDRKYIKCGECKGFGSHQFCGKGGSLCYTRCSTCQGAKFVLRQELKKTCQHCEGKGWTEEFGLR